MTEDEAKTKWCPHVRIPYGDQSTRNREHFGYFSEGNMVFRDTRCLGSECMAWRENGRLVGHDRGQHSDNGEWARFCKENPINGYCGLAGKP